MNGKRWTAAEERRVRALYPVTPTAALARLLGRTPCSVYGAAARLRLHKTPEYLASPAACRLRRGDNVGAAYRFPKGHVPANKGLRRPGYGPGRMRETQFKAGERGNRWMPIGSTRLMDGYEYTKIRDVRSTQSGARFLPYRVNWKATHVLLWEKHRGKVPRGHCLRFKNGDRTDIRMGNLEPVHRHENMRRNSVHRLPRALAQAIQLRGALERQIRRRTA